MEDQPPSAAPQEPPIPAKEPALATEELARRAQEDRYVGEARTKEERLFRAKAVTQARKARAVKARAEAEVASGGKHSDEQNRALS